MCRHIRTFIFFAGFNNTDDQQKIITGGVVAGNETVTNNISLSTYTSKQN
jgi:hypothetical protein